MKLKKKLSPGKERGEDSAVCSHLKKEWKAQKLSKGSP